MCIRDRDGTIINTAPDLMEAHDHVMRKFGFEEKKMADIFFGKFSESISPAGSKPKENKKISVKSSINKKLLLALGCSVAIVAILLIIF